MQQSVSSGGQNTRSTSRLKAPGTGVGGEGRGVSITGNSTLQYHLAKAELHSHGNSTNEMPASSLSSKEAAKGMFIVCISPLEQA